ncbi:hypothetical protein MASR1M45_12610 [Candidatus Kapaibacterium sp.]
MIQIFKSNFKSILDFVSRNATWILGILIPLYFLGFQIQFVNTLALITAAICFLTGLSGIILYAFTNIKFGKHLAEGDDGKMNSVERHAVMDLAGKIFQGVLISGAVIWGIIYLSQFSGSVVP